MKLDAFTYRLKYGLLWKTDTPPRARWKIILLSTVFGFITGALITALALLYQAYYDNSILRKKLIAQHELTTKYSSMVTNVMNGRALYDRASGVAYFFDKPIAIKVKD